MRTRDTKILLRIIVKEDMENHDLLSPKNKWQVNSIFDIDKYIQAIFFKKAEGLHIN